MSDASITALEPLRQLAAKQVKAAITEWANRNPFPGFHDPDRLLARPLHQLTFDEMLSLAIDTELSDSRREQIAARETELLKTVWDIEQGDWVAPLSRRPILVATYLAALGIPALVATGRAAAALEIADQFVTVLRWPAFRRVLGAGDSGRDLPDFRHSYRLMLVSPVLAALSQSLTPDDDAGDAAAALLDNLFSGRDLSPCTAVWGPAVAYSAGIPVAPEWWIGDRYRWPNLMAAYEFAEQSRGAVSSLSRPGSGRDIRSQTATEIFRQAGSV